MSFWGAIISWAIIAFFAAFLFSGLGGDYFVRFWIIFLSLPLIVLIKIICKDRNNEK